MPLRQIAKTLRLSLAYLIYVVTGKRPRSIGLYEKYREFVNTSVPSVSTLLSQERPEYPAITAETRSGTTDSNRQSSAWEADVLPLHQCRKIPGILSPTIARSTVTSPLRNLAPRHLHRLAELWERPDDIVRSGNNGLLPIANRQCKDKLIDNYWPPNYTHICLTEEN